MHEWCWTEKGPKIDKPKTDTSIFNVTRNSKFNMSRGTMNSFKGEIGSPIRLKIQN